MPQRRLPRQVAGLSRRAREGGLPGRPHGQGLGSGRFQGGGFQRNPAGPAYQQYTNKPPLEGIGATDYARNFAAFLEERKPEQPFCFWVGGHEPHRAYEDGSGSAPDTSQRRCPCRRSSPTRT